MKIYILIAQLDYEEFLNVWATPAEQFKERAIEIVENNEFGGMNYFVEIFENGIQVYNSNFGDWLISDEANI
jgi:hypothetical protein